MSFSTFAGGNAPVTRVTKEMFSDLRISQQCLRAETEDSLVLRAEEERACILKESKAEVTTGRWCKKESFVFHYRN